MCFVGVFPPETGLERAGGLKTLREELRSYLHLVSTAQVALSLLMFVLLTAAGPTFAFPGSIPALAKGERLKAVHGSLVPGQYGDSSALSWLDRGSCESQPFLLILSPQKLLSLKN